MASELKAIVELNLSLQHALETVLLFSHALQIHEHPLWQADYSLIYAFFRVSVAAQGLLDYQGRLLQ